ncbi:MAG: hypothetical protein ACLQJ7_17425 [Syntrophobacteraceae bacterium]
MVRLTQGIDGYGQAILAGIQQSDSVIAVVLAYNTAQYIAPPAGANFVLFGVIGNGDFWMQLNVTSGLSLPASTGTCGENPEANPLLRQLNGATSIGLITPISGGCALSLAFYS